MNVSAQPSFFCLEVTFKTQNPLKEAYLKHIDDPIRGWLITPKSLGASGSEVWEEMDLCGLQAGQGLVATVRQTREC